MLKITHKSAYGRDFYYPADEASKRLCEAMQQKTFTPTQLEALEAIGANIELVHAIPGWRKKSEA